MTFLLVNKTYYKINKWQSNLTGVKESDLVVQWIIRIYGENTRLIAVLYLKKDCRHKGSNIYRIMPYY